MNEAQQSQLPLAERSDNDNGQRAAIHVIPENPVAEEEDPRQRDTKTSGERQHPERTQFYMCMCISGHPDFGPFVRYLVSAGPLPLTVMALCRFDLSTELQTLAHIDAFESSYLKTVSMYGPILLPQSAHRLVLAQIEGLRDQAYARGERYEVKGSGLGYPTYRRMRAFKARAQFMPGPVRGAQYGGEETDTWPEPCLNLLLKSQDETINDSRESRQVIAGEEMNMRPEPFLTSEEKLILELRVFRQIIAGEGVPRYDRPVGLVDPLPQAGGDMFFESGIEFRGGTLLAFWSANIPKTVAPASSEASSVVPDVGVPSSQMSAEEAAEATPSRER
jgi:hypothetical protein